MIVVLRAADRFETAGAGIRSWHSFSSGPHFDPDRMGFGPLIGHDEHRLAPGAGFAAHRHRDVDILTWVLEGVLRHEDDAGRVREVRPGQVQYQRAGRGITHSEGNASDTEPARFLQMLLRPDRAPGDSGYALRHVTVAPGQSVLVASGRIGAPITLALAAEVSVLGLTAGCAAPVDPSPGLRHIHVTRGQVAFDGLVGGPLAAGDSVDLTGDDGTAALLLSAAVPSEVLLVSAHERPDP